MSRLLFVPMAAQPSHPATSGAGLAPRAIAEDVSQWYRSVADPTVPHSENVAAHLREAMLVITRRTILGEHLEDGAFVGDNHATPSDRRGGASWVSSMYAGQAASYDSLEDDGAVSTTAATDAAAAAGAATSGTEASGVHLGRRSAYRLRAFLTSCQLAVTDDPFPTQSSVSPSSSTSGKSLTGREAEAKRAAASADATSRQLLGGSLRDTKAGGGGGGDSDKERSQAPNHASPQPQSLPESARVGTDTLSLSAALSGFSVAEGEKEALKEIGDGSVDRGTEIGREQQKGQENVGILLHKPSLAALASTPTFRKGRLQRHPQFQTDDLAVRVELYVRSLRRVRETGNECVVTLEPPRAIRARVDAVVDSFVNTIGCVRGVGPVLSKLVGSLTRELLAVEMLGEELTQAIDRLTSEYEHRTSFASLAFLSTPEDTAGAHLSPLLLSYIGYLQSDWERLAAHCQQESMLSRAIEPDIRRMFKTIEFTSIGHLLNVCHRHRDHLQNIRLPRAKEGDISAQCMDSRVLKQAMKDVRREIITVNGHILPPAQNLKDLVRLLTEALNSKTMTLSQGTRSSRRSGKKSAEEDDTEIQGGDVGKCESVEVIAKKSNGKASSSSGENERAFDAKSDTISDSELSSGVEGDTDGSSSGISDLEEPAPKRNSSVKPRKRKKLSVGAIEFMTRRILIAASRSRTGGDAFFVVRDLFGGEEVEVLPSKSQPRYSSSRPSMIGRVPRKGYGGTIELIVRLASVIIKCHGRYDVYPMPVREDCEPLIELHTTTTETVSIHEVRDTEAPESAGTVLALIEKKTETSGSRSLLIFPALYEKVEDLNTPS